MSNRRIVSVAAVATSATAYTGRADGLFSTNDQAKLKQAGNWPTAIKAPSSPTITSGTAGDSSATILFTPPSQLNGETIIGYRATTDPGNITADSTSSPLTITGLTNNVTYSITLATNSNSGLGPQSTSISLMPVPPPPGAPTMRGWAEMAPGYVFGAIRVYFKPPVVDSNYPITSYNLYRSTDGSSYGLIRSLSVSDITNSVKDSYGNSFTTDPSLSGSTTYYYKVSAVNSVGEGPLSSSASQTTGAAFPAVGQAYAGGYYAGTSYDAAWNQVAVVIKPNNGSNPSYALLPSGDQLQWSGLANTDDYYNGAINTNAFYNTGKSPAANYVKGLTTNGYTDWYIPSYTELYAFKYLVYQNSPWFNGVEAFRSDNYPILGSTIFYRTNNTMYSPHCWIFNYPSAYNYGWISNWNYTNDEASHFVAANQYMRSDTAAEIRAVRRSTYYYQ
jgi:hypothetical protein